MPNWFPSYTNCSDPSDWYSIPIAGIAIVGGIGVAGFIALAAAGSWLPGVAVFLATACLGAILFCTWWLNIRLICLGGDRSAIGAIYYVDPPTPSLDAFAFGDYDTDYSFNLLLWPYIPQDELPATFISSEWSMAAASQLQTDWPTLFPGLSFTQVPMIIPQQTMASLGLGFTGKDVESGDEPSPQPATGSSQHLLLHCEIEGPGMYDLRILFYVLFAMFIAAAAVYAIPIIGPALCWILSILALLALLFGGPIIQHDVASPPTDGGWGGSFNTYSGSASPDSLVDIAYCYGRWVYDSLHTGWNELHPLHFMIKIGTTSQGVLANGTWPDGLGDTKAKYDAQFKVINMPSSSQTQSQPENTWGLHPLLDGCQGSVLSPSPPPA
jgi:hypothetical protein